MDWKTPRFMTGCRPSPVPGDAPPLEARRADISTRKSAQRIPDDVRRNNRQKKSDFLLTKMTDQVIYKPSTFCCGRRNVGSRSKHLSRNLSECCPVIPLLVTGPFFALYSGTVSGCRVCFFLSARSVSAVREAAFRSRAPGGTVDFCFPSRIATFHVTSGISQ